MGYIYLITNSINNKQYIGQSISIDINTRWKQYKKLDKSSIGRVLYNAFIKYGINNFKFQIICICFDNDCNNFEKEYIKKYNTISPNGYNLKEGGNNSKHHPETIALIKESLKGKITCPIRDDIRKKISESLKGEKNPNYGKNINDEQRKKISYAMKQYWKDKVLSNKNSLNNLKIGATSLRKKVGQYTKDDKVIQIFDSISEAARISNINITNISKVCNNIKPYKSAGGFIWKFI